MKDILKVTGYCVGILGAVALFWWGVGTLLGWLFVSIVGYFQ